MRYDQWISVFDKFSLLAYQFTKCSYKFNHSSYEAFTKSNQDNILLSFVFNKTKIGTTSK